MQIIGSTKPCHPHVLVFDTENVPNNQAVGRHVEVLHHFPSVVNRTIGGIRCGVGSDGCETIDITPYSDCLIVHDISGYPQDTHRHLTTELSSINNCIVPEIDTVREFSLTGHRKTPSKCGSWCWEEGGTNSELRAYAALHSTEPLWYRHPIPT